MASGEKHIVKFWRGTRDSYNILWNAGTLDYWTRYSVKEPSGIWTEYYGTNRISETPGQLLPVLDIVKTIDGLQLKNGDRYLVGEDAVGGQPESYNIVEVRVAPDGKGTYKSNSVVLPFDESYTVRVKSRDYMTYQLVNGKLITYDQVDCGTY